MLDARRLARVHAHVGAARRRRRAHQHAARVVRLGGGEELDGLCRDRFLDLYAEKRQLPPESFLADPRTVENIRRELGTDRSLPVQYGIFVANALRGKLPGTARGVIARAVAAFDDESVRRVLAELLAHVVAPGWSNALAAKLVALTGRRPAETHRLLDAQAQRREDLFQQSVAAERTRGDALSQRFEEALRQAREEPITRPKRDFDWD